MDTTRHIDLENTGVTNMFLDFRHGGGSSDLVNGSIGALGS